MNREPRQNTFDKTNEAPNAAAIGVAGVAEAMARLKNREFVYRRMQRMLRANAASGEIGAGVEIRYGALRSFARATAARLVLSEAAFDYSSEQLSAWAVPLPERANPEAQEADRQDEPVTGQALLLTTEGALVNKTQGEDIWFADSAAYAEPDDYIIDDAWQGLAQLMRKA